MSPDSEAPDPAMPAAGVFVHASAVVIGEKGVLITGASGTGKSALAQRIIAEACQRGLFARLVGDDRIGLRALNGRLIAAPHPAIAGRIERRGVGLLDTDFVPAALIHGLIRLESMPQRLPEAGALHAILSGIALPVLPLKDDLDLAGKAHLVIDWLRP